MTPERAKCWDLGLVAGGACLILATHRIYRTFEAPGGRPSPIILSPQEADRRVTSAKSHLESHPEDFNAYAQLAIAYYHMGPEHYADAMNALDRARALGATSEALFFYAGVMYDTLGLPDYAANELTKYLRHHPDDYEAQIRLANLYLRQKKYDEARRLYGQALKHWPKDPTAWFNYAIVNKEKGDLNQAMACLEKVKQLAGQLPEGGLHLEGELQKRIEELAHPR